MLGSEFTSIPTRTTTRPRVTLWSPPQRAAGRLRTPLETTLERELGDVLSAAQLDSRQARAVAGRLGWDGGGGGTLAVAGEREGYTRERVRQLEERVVAHLRRARPLLPAVEHALAIVSAAAPARRSDLALALRDAGLSNRLFDPAGVISAARLLGEDPPLVLNDTLVLAEGRGDESADALVTARRLARRSGPVHAVDVAVELGAFDGRIERLLRLRDELLELSVPGWFVPRRGPRSRNELRLRKILSVVRELSVDEIGAALRRGPRAVPLPGPVLAAYCDLLPWTVVDRAAGVVRAKVALDPARELSAGELCVYELLREHGSLDITTGAGLAAERGLNLATAGFVLRYSPITRTSGRGRMALVARQEAAAAA
jgi:hypothetical protein